MTVRIGIEKPFENSLTPIHDKHSIQNDNKRKHPQTNNECLEKSTAMLYIYLYKFVATFFIAS